MFPFFVSQALLHINGPFGLFIEFLLLQLFFHDLFMTEYFYCNSVDGKQIKMSEDHRIASYSERLRIQETGEPLKDGETRLCGRCYYCFVNLLFCLLYWN